MDRKADCIETLYSLVHLEDSIVILPTDHHPLDVHLYNRILFRYTAWETSIRSMHYQTILRLSCQADRI
jgi:hypothetical protein